MRVMKGETVEVDGTWRKLEVTYEEQEFLDALMLRGMNPTGIVNPTVKFKIMSAEVDKLLIVTLAQAYPQQFDREEAAEQVRELNQRLEKYWSEL